MSGLGGEQAARLRWAANLRESVPITPLALQQIVAEATKQYIVGAGVLRVQLEAIALEQLDQVGLAFNLLLRGGRLGQAKHRQATVLVPEVAEGDVGPGRSSV